MPELPEVETIRLGLQKYLVGHTIEDVEVRLKKIVQGDVKHVVGGTVTAVKRFGKGLVIELDNDYCLAIHIKLTGQLIYQSSEVSKERKVPNVSKVKVIRDTYSTLPNKWTHVIFTLKRENGMGKGGSDHAYLYYNDFRQFGWIKIVPLTDLPKLEFFKGLGPEFFRDLTLQKFAQIVAKAKTSIKPLLMDQKKMSGLGNIYANDGLNLAKIDPRRKSSSLSKEEINRLYKSLKIVLHRGLEYGGASELSYVNALGQEGSYQNHFLVYGQDGKQCKNCGGKIKKIMLGGRGTYFCPNCQR